MIELWTINRVLRWTGFVFVVAVAEDLDAPDREPTRIGFKWVGLPPERSWDKIVARSRGVR